MHFRVQCTVDGLIERGFDESIAYDCQRDFASHIFIQRSEAIRGDAKRPCVLVMCTAELDLEHSDALSDLVTAITTSKDGVHINLEKAGDQAKPLFAIVDPVFGKLREDLERTTMLLNWRYGITDKPLKSFSDRAESLSLDGTTWRNITPIRGLKIVFLGSHGKSEESVAEDIRSMFYAGLELPLALQLLVEAKSQMRTYPRSALVIGVTAAEIALKQLIGELAPDARWLAENVPSPPIFKIARDYIPTLKIRAQFKDKSLNIPKELLKQLANAVELRNKAVHVGEAPPDFESLIHILRAMEDMIWICCLFTGYPWAGEFISYETKMTWK